MGKINIRTVLKNITENKYFCNETIALYDENKIKYIDNKITVVIIVEDEKLTIVRRSNEYEIVLPLEKGKTKKGVYKIDGLGEMDLDVYTKELSIEDEKIEIEYAMVMDKENKTEFKFNIEYGEQI